MSINFQS